MRGIHLFVAGIVVGASVQIAIAQNQDQGVVGLNHVGISVVDLDEAVTYYTETLGFPEAFRVIGDDGQVILVYVQVSRNTFIELQPANPQRPAGINHFGLQVEDMAGAREMFKGRGADVAETRSGSTKAILSNISDPNGIRIELLEFPADSLQALASEHWH